MDTFTDEGVSGFKGKNFSNESALSAFLKLVENRTVEKGSVLIVENMDRLSRQSIIPCMTKFMEIIGKGVSIGVICNLHFRGFALSSKTWQQSGTN